MAKIFKEFNEEKWEQVRTHPYFAEYRERAIARAEKNIVTDPPVIKFSLIHRYVTDGNREVFEKVRNEYFQRMENLFAVYMITKDDKYISPLADIIWNICDLEAWSIPAHVAETLPLDERRKNLDLCSCISGMYLSELIYFIGDKLPELVLRRAKAEIRYRIIDSYANFKPERYWWPTATNNWSAVCISAVLATYLYAAEPEQIEAQLPRMIASADCYLEGFAEDGCCTEGYAYWNYGFSYFCKFAALLCEYTDGKINYFDNPKVARIARFQESIPLNENQCVSFSDATIEFVPVAWLTHFLKGVYPDLRIPKIPAGLSDSPSMRQLLWQNPDMYESSLDATEPVSFSFDNAQWFIYRTEGYAFGCKAGNNQEMHNHNDVGSFLVSKGRGVSFCDPGVGQYTRQYFSPQRYDLMLCSSRGHSVPIINGTLQDTIGDQAQIYVHENNRYCFSMEKVYKVDTLTRLTRDFICEGDGVKMTDTYEFTKTPDSVVERFVSLHPISEVEDGLACLDSVMVYDKSLFTISFGQETVERKQGKTGVVYYADLTVKEPMANMEFTFKFI